MRGYAKRSLALSEVIHISRAGSLIYFLTIFLYPQNLLSPSIRDLKLLENSGFHQNVDLSSLLTSLFQIFKILSEKRASVKIVNFRSFFS